MEQRKRKMNIAVAMSGGVDSSVAAALLVRQRYAVMGGFMKNFSAESWNGVLDADCPWERDQADAQAVCRQLGIPFRSFNFEREYRHQVIDYFFEEYRRGRTPNPDVRCNREIKFRAFLEAVKALGFTHVATGHYARVRNGLLYRGLDPLKDQSYFLHALDREQLRQVIFPLGGLTKRHVRTLARRLGLPTAEKKDSQGICFVGRVDLRQFLQQRLQPLRGPIRDTAGRLLGEHPGVWYYTIGQRHGLCLGGTTVPYYVVSKDVAGNTLIVARGRGNRSLYRTTLRVAGFHWIGGIPRLPLRCQAKIRSQQRPESCTARRVGKNIQLSFDQPQFAVASGQAAVLLAGDRILGGGTIIA